MNQFLPKLLNKIGILEKFNLNSKVKINNKKFLIPIIKKIGYQNLYQTEIWMVDVLKKLYPLLKGTFVDVGANMGQTLLKFKSVNTNLSYIGFEPNSNCVFYLHELIKVNGFKDTELFPIGISTTNDVLSLKLYADNEIDSLASIIEDFRSQKIYRTLNVPIFTVDSLIKAKKITDPVSLIKIDVEGAELEVLESFYETIKSNLPIIFIEILPVYNSENIFRLNRQKKIEDLMNKFGYLFFRVIKNKDESLKELKYIDEIGIHSEISWSDYILIPKVKTQGIINY